MALEYTDVKFHSLVTPMQLSVGLFWIKGEPQPFAERVFLCRVEGWFTVDITLRDFRVPQDDPYYAWSQRP